MAVGPEFPSNSQKARTPQPSEEKKIERVVVGEVVRRKKPVGKRFVQLFFVGGDAKTIWGFLTEDVVVPQLKDLFLDVVREGAERMVLGDSARTRRRSREGSFGNIAYNRYSKEPPRESHDRHRQISHRARATHDFDEILLSSRVEAEEILEQLYEIISKYQSASVADLYAMANIESEFTDKKWGWESLPGAGIQRTRSGFLLNLPKPEPLD